MAIHEFGEGFRFAPPSARDELRFIVLRIRSGFGLVHGKSPRSLAAVKVFEDFHASCAPGFVQHQRGFQCDDPFSLTENVGIDINGMLVRDNTREAVEAKNEARRAKRW